MSHRALMRAIAHAKSQRASDALGLQAAWRSEGDVFVVLHYLVRTSGTLLDALNALAKYINLLHDGARLVLESEGDMMFARLDLARDLEACLELSEFAVASLILCLRAASDFPFAIKEVRLAHALPKNARLRELAFGCEAIRGGPATGVLFVAADALHPNAHRDPVLNAMLQDYASSLLERQRGVRSFREQVRELLVNMLPRCGTNADQIAAELGVSTRTLHRRLASEKTSFRASSDEVRKELALEWLAQGGLSLDEISARLGFSHTNSFHRAFRRWTARRPSELRDEST